MFGGVLHFYHEEDLCSGRMLQTQKSCVLPPPLRCCKRAWTSSTTGTERVLASMSPRHAHQVELATAFQIRRWPSQLEELEASHVPRGLDSTKQPYVGALSPQLCCGCNQRAFIPLVSSRFASICLPLTSPPPSSPPLTLNHSPTHSLTVSLTPPQRQEEGDIYRCADSLGFITPGVYGSVSIKRWSH